MGGRKIRAIGVDKNPETFFHELADEYAGKCHGAIVMLLTKEFQIDTWCSGGLSGMERLYMAELLLFFLRHEIFLGDEGALEPEPSG